MKGTKKCAESRQLHNEGCPREIRVEPRSNAGAPSISSMPEKGRNGDNEYASGLQERILHRDNMNLAYKRVKANKGSYGVEDGRVLSLIRKYLQSGVMINGVVQDTEEGCPQGGPLSPLLSNIMLNEWDIELNQKRIKILPLRG